MTSQLANAGAGPKARRFAQKMQAELAVEALAAFLSQHARVRPDRYESEGNAWQLVPRDVLLIKEGDKICADARLLTGTVEVDMSMLARG